MSILTGSEILAQLNKTILIEPFNEENLNPNSYNLSLAPNIEYFTPNRILDAKKDIEGIKHVIGPEGFLLLPNHLVLASTVEWTETRSLVPKLDGRSSVARLGICVHLTAGFGDIGFCGNWTLEISAVIPVWIYAGMKICQISYETIHGNIDRSYEGKYQGSEGVKRSKLHRELV